MTQLPRTPSFSLEGRHALVTGGSSGIGLGCAVALAEAGARVTIVARRREQLDGAVAAMAEAGLAAEALAGDIADIGSMAAAIDSLRPLDIFVNSAGLARHSPATETQ
ncbi:MAG: SDR family NAD(P)-dependent oxidoreductase, partial [Pseudomonadota bacterium]|nr:SDR family NAD(P)-dependent oxidoreductase [Pseudomonadota bacterium]